jgi:NOL1/NOP2/fmu family ribosome biogenesis protein
MRALILKYLRDRFEIPKKIFSDYSFIIKGEKIWIVARDVLEKDLEGLKIESIGLLFGRYFERQKRFKPTTNALQIFGKYATKNVVELNEKEKNQYIRGYDLEKELNLEEGYVIIKFKNDMLGCGLYREGKIKNQIPKARKII